MGSPPRVWTDDEMAFIRQHYHNTPTKVFTDRFRCSKRSLFAKAYKMGVSKSPEYLAESRRKFFEAGLSVRFKPGHKPTWEHRYVRPETNKSWFVKGEYVPPHTTSVGTIRLRSAKGKPGSVAWIKTGEKEWKRLIHHIWEQAGKEYNSRVDALYQISGDMMSPTVEDIICVPKSQFMLISCHGYNVEQSECLDIINKIKKEIGDGSKK